MDQQSFIYKFLLAPGYRVWRYITLILFFTIVSVNQALVGFDNILPVLGNKVYWIVAVTILVYIITVFFLQKVIVKYLLSGKYVRFVFYIFLCAVIFELVPNLVFLLYEDNYDFFSEIVIVDNISSFIIYLLCISGVIIPIFLRNWLVSSQYLNEIKKKQQLSKIETLKEQINPASFFKVLNKSGSLVKSDPDKASAILMKLSQLLRYQLYDCNRNKVLLTAEISFIRNFLELESLYSTKFRYTIQTTGNINGIFMSPSIFLPYVQSVINILNEREEPGQIDLKIDVDDKNITIIIDTLNLQNTLQLENELLKLRERLNILYSGHYKLVITNNNNDCYTEVCLQLDKK